MKTILTATATVALSTTAAFAGLDRATFSPNILFEEGNYAEISFGITNPSVRPTPATARVNVAPSFTTVQFGYKQQFSDQFSGALLFNGNPFGVNIDYSPLANPLGAKLESTSLTLLGKYSASERVSLFGGLRYTTTEGTADLTPSGLPEELRVKGSGTDFILGAAYEIPAIALRASLSYESGTELDPEVVGVTSGTNYGVGQINVAEALTLNFQTGVAENTLAFATIRHAKYEDAQVLLAPLLGSAQISDFDNTTAISLGVARRFTDNFAMSISASYQASGDDPVSPLSPTNGIKGISLGGRYTADNGVVTSLGLSYSKRGDAIADLNPDGVVGAGDLPFSGNKVITVGLKIGKSF